ncbi:MAG: hypothetical protein Q9157_002165 [Trypethelium eluteriae]
MQSPPNHSPQGPFDVAEKGVDRTDDDRPVFKTEHYDKLEKPGAIRILNVFPGHPEDLEVHCELILGTILDSKQRLEHNPPIKFVPYDALSWCWGIQNEESWINIRKGGTRYAKAVRSDLVAALRALRHHEHDRRLWIDAVCIDEDNVTERNRQVEMMADIYGNADCVRIWLGNPSESSRIAIRFIKKEVLQLQHFDELCESEKATEKWKSLLELMQRPWFSRRWVVQEVALARKAIIHCGSAKIAWNKFAVAVELFVEVETATHRLSEVMKKDPKYYHVPMWFEYVSALGASLLVRATSELFRDYQHSSKASEGKKKPAVKKKSSPEPDEVDIESEDDEVVSPRERALQYERDSLENGVVPKAQPLLDLEYLVCSLSIFNVLKPHDTIYALLGIAKDTSPTAANQEFRVSDHTERALEMFMEKKRYTVSYEAPYVDVCKEFIQFCIERALHIDPSRALDVICRPWAAELSLSAKSADEMSMPSWIPQLSKASYGMDTKPGVEGMKMGRKNADPLVGLPTLTHRNYKAAETKGLDMKSFRFRKRELELENVVSTQTGRNLIKTAEPSGIDNDANVQNASQPYTSPAVHEQDAADELQQGQQLEQGGKECNGENGTAQGKEPSKTSTRLKNESRTQLKYFSMYVKGFILDEIQDVQPSSQNGSIPSEWAEFAGWRNTQGDPPDRFWRTLVADRGRDGKNPPVYYSRACKESFNKGSFQSGTVDTNGLISNERNSVVAQFCRRVQAAIWNRALVRTKHGKLGLVSKNVQAGDLVCILYGCSVPVILRKNGPKNPGVLDIEMEWELKYLAERAAGYYSNHLVKREKFRSKRMEDDEHYMKWERAKREMWKGDKRWADHWKKTRQALMLIHEFNSWVMKEKAIGKRSKKEIETLENMVNVALKDKCNPTRTTEQQKRVWKEFKDDKSQRDQWQRDNNRYSEEDGFRIWLKQGKRKSGYPEEWKKSRDEWCQDHQWKNDWRAENSRFLCIDSFRAWLREQGKFCGTKEDVKNKQEWEEDTDWRQEWRSVHQDASEDDEFNAWMGKSGRKGEEPQAVKTQEEFNQYLEWRKHWTPDPKNSSLRDSIDAWEKEQMKRATQERNLDRLRAEAASKQQREPFLERWRKDWTPPTVNWREMSLALSYGRRWKRLVEGEKNDHIQKLKDSWCSPEKQKQRQADRRSGYEKTKTQQDEAIRKQNARVRTARDSSISRHNGEQKNDQKIAGRRKSSQADCVPKGHQAHASEDGFPDIKTNDRGMQVGDGGGNDEVGKEIAEENQIKGIPESNSGPAMAERNHDDGNEGDHSILFKIPGQDSDSYSSEDRTDTNEHRFRLDRAETSALWQKHQSSLTHNIRSKEDLKSRIEEMKGQMSGPWRRLQEKIEECPKGWRDNMPRRMRTGTKVYDYDCGRKDGKRKLRQRLSEKDACAYGEKIVANLRARLGDDGRYWYQMFGECYIHGMMDGEAMAHQNNKGECAPTEVFDWSNASSAPASTVCRPA